MEFSPFSLRDRYRAQWHEKILEHKIFWGKFVRLFFRPPFPMLQDGRINLHLGCGDIAHPDFVNIDGIPAKHIHYVRAIDKLSPFQDNSVDLVYASHCLEHFSHLKITNVLREWHRVLKINGILRLSVPDFNLILDIYNNNSQEINTIMAPLMGGQDYKLNIHYSVFTCSSLTALLTQVGFREVRRWQPGSSELTTFEDWSNRKIQVSGKEYPVSLNLEAVK
jgi:SAM-dependent methyltransferase